jgi:hypothetical protein
LSATVSPGMTESMWTVGDVCFVAGEGEEVFVVESVGPAQVSLFGHGREPLENPRLEGRVMAEMFSELARLSMLALPEAQR